MWKKIHLLILLFAFLGCDLPVKKNLTGMNAIWCESIYLRGYDPRTNQPLTIDKIKALALTLKKHNIKYAYLFAGPYATDGHLPSYSFSNHAVESVRILKKYYPGIVILPWVGGIENKTVHLDDTAWVKIALEDTKRLVSRLSVPGVHVDLEFIKKGDHYLDTTMGKEKPLDMINYGNYVNDFHKKLRILLPDKFISSVVVATAPDTKPWKRKTSMKELFELTGYIDQLSFLYYDTSINDEKTYEKNCLDQIKDIQRLKAENNIQYLISIGTFINVPQLHKYRNMSIENIPNALSCIKKSLNELKSPRNVVSGISIFCNWQTDENEWDEIDKYSIQLP